MTFFETIDLTVLVNLILILAIVGISLWGYYRIGKPTPLYFGAAYLLFALSHFILLFNITQVPEAVHILIRITGYILVAVGLFALLQVILEFERVEDQKQKSQALFKTIFDSAGDAIMIMNQDVILDCNRSAEVMFGCNRDNINGKSPVAFSPEHQPDRVLSAEKAKEKMDAALLGETQFFEWVYIRSDGTPFNAEVTLNRVKCAKKYYLRAIVRDITRRKEAEEKLRVAYEKITATEEDLRQKYSVLAETEEMFRSPVEHSSVGIYLHQDGIIKYANPRFAEMFGYAREEVVNKPFELMIYPDDRAKYHETQNRQLEGTGSSRYVEFRSTKKDGTQIELEAFEFPMFFHGRPAFYGTLVDITDRKQMELQLEQSLKEKEVLLKEIHHRVKNNMQVISSLLSMQSRLVTDESSKQFFLESQNRVKSLALVHEHLYRSQSLSEINYADYLKKIVPHLFESYNTDPRRISIVTEAKDIMISIDQAVPCSLMVNELITNSLKYAFPGDRKGEIRLVFTTDTTTGNYVLDYRDNGVGIPPGLDLQKTKSLGMQLIYGLTKQLSGTVMLEPDEGVHFIIAFPAGDPKKKQA